MTTSHRSTLPSLLGASLLGALLSAAPLCAQAAFTPGDLFLYTTAATGISSTDGGLRRIDPGTGVNTLLVDFDGTASWPGAAVYDPYRDRILFTATLDGPNTPFRLWQVDATGHTESIPGFFDLPLRMMAATGDGRVYLRAGNGHLFHWLDQANRIHLLLDATGTQAFTLPGSGGGFPWRTMSYDPGTNALLVLGPGATGPCSGASSVITVHKLPLSADGSRVVGPISCNEADVDSFGFEEVVDVGRRPTGELLVFADSNSGGNQPRILQVDPATLAITTFASNTIVALNGGTWSSALGQAVALDTFNDDLKAFPAGSSGGSGTPLGTSPGASPGGSSHETTTLFEIEDDGCPGAFIPFGVGLAGAGGLVPALFGGGCPLPGQAFTLGLRDAVGGAPGAIFLSLSEGAAPFKGGLLYPVPLLLDVGLSVGGTPGLAGAGDLDLPAALPNDPGLSGTTLVLQAGFADDEAVVDVSLTQGLRVVIG